VRTVFIGQKVYQRSKDKLERAESKAHGRSKPMSEKKEYIERGALIKKLNNLVTTSDLFGMGVQSGFSHAISEANAIPAADVEPVVRGEWKWYDRKEAEIYAPLGMVVCAESYVCSNCGNYIGRSSPRDYRPKYCDNCGANMERSGSGETY
jgi:hypothetical protein